VRQLRIESQPLAGSHGLVSDLLAGEPRALDLFPAGAFGAGQAVHAADIVRKVAIAASAFHCPHPAARERLRAVLEGQGLVVSTGQQPQLFGGPLYVLYKAIAAVRVAARIEAEVGMPCLAVFWVAGDDHDWREVGTVGYLDAEEHLRSLSVSPSPGRVGRSVGPSALPSDIETTLREFLDALETGESGRPWRDVLRSAYVPGRSFTDAFMAALAAWTAGLPIAFLDSAHADTRSAAIPFIQRVLSERTAVDEALREGTAAVEALGYPIQLSHTAEAIPVFRDGQSGRYRLRGLADPIAIDAGGTLLHVQDLLEEAGSRPDRYSPAAALRPVLESWLLPVAASVLGPGEIAYWAQLQPLFEGLEVPLPHIVPRDSWRVVEPRVARLLARSEVTAADLRDGGGKATADLVRRHHPRSVEAALQRIESDIEGGFGTLEAEVAKDLPGLNAAVGKGRTQTLGALEALRKTMRRMTREREAAAVSQLQRAALNLYPGGVPQERAFATWMYLVRHGDSLLDAVRAAAGVTLPTSGPDGEKDVAGAPREE